MRKRIGILAIVAVLCLTGTALAHGEHGRGRGDRPFGGEKFGRPGGPAFERRDEGRRFDRGWENPRRERREMPQSIRNKLEESRKLMNDMRAELRKTPFNRARVLQLRARSLRLRQEASDWLFTQRLDAIEKALKNRSAPIQAPK